MTHFVMNPARSLFFSFANGFETVDGIRAHGFQTQTVIWGWSVSCLI
jgi:hypothetical protein